MKKQEVPEDEYQRHQRYNRGGKKLKVVHDALLNSIDQSKVAPLIVKKETYKAMTMAVPLLYQLVEIKSVVHHSVQSVSMDKNWAALGLVGKKEKHGDTTLGYIRSFGVDNKWQVDMEGLSGSNTIHFIDRLFTEVKRHIPGASNLPV